MDTPGNNPFVRFKQNQQQEQPKVFQTIAADPESDIPPESNVSSAIERPISNQEPSQSENPFVRFKQKQVEDQKHDQELQESWLEWYSRNYLSGTARGLEALGGFPGDLRDVVYNIGGVTSPEEREKKLEEMAKQKGLTSKYLDPGYYVSKAADLLPTSQDLKKVTEKVSGDFTKPRTEKEKVFQTMAGDFANLVNPASAQKFKGPLRLVAMTIAPELSKQTMKWFGFKEPTQDYTKLGTQLVTALFNPRGALRSAENALNEAQHMVRNAPTRVPQLVTYLNNLRTNMLRGSPEINPDKQAVLRAIDAVENTIQNGSALVENLIQSKRDIYRMIGNWETPKGARDLLKPLARQIDEQVIRFGQQNRQSFPNFLPAYQYGNNLYSTTLSSQRVSNWIERNWKYFAATTGAHGIAAGKLFSPLIGGSVLGGVAGSYAGIKGLEVLTRVIRSPEARRFYGNAINAALMEDLPLFNASFNKLIDSMKEKSNPDYKKGKPAK